MLAKLQEDINEQCVQQSVASLVYTGHIAIVRLCMRRLVGDSQHGPTRDCVAVPSGCKLGVCSGRAGERACEYVTFIAACVAAEA